MKKITVLVHIDSLRHDYVNKKDMPFLCLLGATGINSTIIPPFGFEPDGAYLTGTYPETYQGGAHFIFRENSPGIPFSKLIPSQFDRLDKYTQYPVRKFLQMLISVFGGSERIRVTPFIGQIPFSLLPYFDYCDYRMPNEHCFKRNVKTVFDYLRDAQMDFFYQGPFGFDCKAEKVKNLVKSQFSEDVPFMFLFIEDLDKVGHELGPDSDLCRKTANLVDKALSDIYQFLKKKYHEIEIIVFGDHGMVKVTEYLDFKTILNKLPLVIGDDYIYFLDSTFVRFWFFKENARDIMLSELKTIKGGRIVSESEKVKYRIRYKNRKFGDLIFWIDAGAMLFPNFWHVKNKKKGMHGYRDEAIDNHAKFIFHSSKNEIKCCLPKIEMVDVFQTTYYSLFGRTIKSKNICGEAVQNMVSSTQRYY